ncbi:cytochrome B [Halobacteriales archaeon QS_8_69_26]|nr:MAG: cytochrome B [Halobacteriales archaeon QS_8_69_26]
MDDKYPTDSDRRRFVKGVVGGAVLSGVGTTAAATVNSLTAPAGAGGGTTRYRGVENTAGPAPRGMPQIPVEIQENDQGEEILVGVWPEEIDEEAGIAVSEDYGGSGVDYKSSWYQYCGVQTYPGVDPQADKDNTLYYVESNPQFQWQEEEVELGAPVKVSDFEDYETWGNGIGEAGIGKPAAANWRSEGEDPTETMPVQILRSTRIEEMAQEDDWIAASTERGFMAILNKCTHFCCVPGFKHTEQAVEFGGANRIYCQCHQSIYDPFNVLDLQFVALPRPSE